MESKRPLRCELSESGARGMRGTQVVRMYDDERGLCVSVVPAAGGEISSLRVRLGRRRREILYRALDYQTEPPDGWRGRAPLLWPAVGRSFTAGQIAKWRARGLEPKHCRFTSAGRTYALGNHGFAKDAVWGLDGMGYGEQRSAWVTCGLRSSARTRRVYPFTFEMSVTHRIERGIIRSRYEIEAGRNGRPMPFCIGNHISFRLPFTGKGRFGECAIRTPARRRLLLNDIALLSGRSRRINLSRPVALESGEFLDAVLGGYCRRNAWVELSDPRSLTIRISHAEVRAGREFLAAERDVFFVFWGNPECGYFCPEPWIGRPNALNTGRGLVRLAPGRRFIWEMVIQLQRR